MSKPKNDKWRLFILGLSKDDLQTLAINAVEAMLEADMVRYRERKEYGPDDVEPEEIYWESCGDSLIDD
jgi:hypothetical protein